MKQKSVLLTAVGLLFATTTTLAQTYPNRPIRLIVPFPSGGPTDVAGRTAGRIISEALGQPVVVENRAGAGGTIGNDLIAKAAPDGYTIGIGTISTLSVAVTLNPNLPYDPIKDVTPITNIVQTIGAIIAHPSFAPNTLREMIALAKLKPDTIAYASPGMGTIMHLGAEHFGKLADIRMVHVPYRGASPALADVLAGAIPVSFDSSLTSAAPNVKAGKVKLLAVTGAARSPLFPDTPTVAELGFPGYDSSAWFGLVGPGNLPRDIVSRIHQVVAKGLREKDVVDRFAAIGADVIADTPEQFAKRIRDDIARWAPVVRSSGIKID